MWTEGLVNIEGDRAEVSGKYVVAKVDIPRGTEILRERPAVLGPKQSQNIVCVQCCRVLTTFEICQKCGLTLCNACDKEPLQHKAECDIFVANNKKFMSSSVQDAVKTYTLVTVLRLLLSGKVNELESHLERREGTPIWLYVETSVVPILSRLLDTNNEPLFTPELIHKAAGVLDTNTFELRTENSLTGEVEMLGRALYSSASLLNNNCRPSVRRTFVSEEIRLVTSREVSAGEELSICYTGLLLPTHIRQTVFSQTKHFTCGCERCRDPSELDTHLGSFLCTECGVTLAPGKLLDLENEEVTSIACPDCGERITREDVMDLFERCETLVRRLDKDTDYMVWMSLGKKLAKMLPTNNFLLVQFKEKYLKFVDQNEGQDAFSKYREEVINLKNILEPSAVDKLDQENTNSNSKKIMYGKDIVKQLMATKLSKHLESKTLSELTK